MNIGQLIELHELALERVGKYPKKRFLYERLVKERGRHFVGIMGPRGVGKTVMLRQYARANEGAFYLSADTLDPDIDPWPLLKTLREKLGFHTFLLDEVHFFRDSSGLLKRLYDFLDVRVVFSSSVALAMDVSRHDLSRRVRMLTLHTFSYREYLYFSQGKTLARLDLASLQNEQWSAEHVRHGFLFDSYLTGGQLPYAIEEIEPLVLLQNILDKVTTRDLPSVVRLTVDELAVIKRMLRFIGRSAVDGINYSSLSRNLSITKYKAAQYVGALEKAFVLHQVFPFGTNVLREPKVLMAPPYRLLFRDYEDCVGGLREDFFCQSMVQAGVDIHYLKTKRGAKTPDFLITGPEKVVIEVGGSGKGRRQFKGLEVDKKFIAAHIEVPQENRIPLFMFGYLS